VKCVVVCSATNSNKDTLSPFMQLKMRVIIFLSLHIEYFKRHVRNRMFSYGSNLNLFGGVLDSLQEAIIEGDLGVTLNLGLAENMPSFQVKRYFIWGPKFRKTNGL
jgi:hypothetical protein